MVASLRSRNGEAVKIAERLKGGGHPNAAGAVMPRSTRSIPQALDYLKEVLNPTVPKAAGLNDLKSLFDAIDVDDSSAKS
jgi:nanoRNase/pAp phosphatase (c-di-AMP/oligoRNAs hydrolase)